MSLPNQYDLDHLVLPEIRNAIRDAEGGNPRDVAGALFGLLALVHDLADEVIRLKVEVERGR